MAASSVALVRSLVVVEVKEPLKGRVQLLHGGEIPAAEGDAPMLVKDRALQALDEAVRPGVARLGARVSDPEVVTRRIETALEFTASAREDPLERPSGGLVERQQGVDEEAHGMVDVNSISTQFNLDLHWPHFNLSK